METPDFVFKGIQNSPEHVKTAWQSPSNIAIVKYWGKIGDQIPANASLSLTLDACHTRTEVGYRKRESGEKQQINFFFEGKEAPEFGQKSFSFIQKIRGFQPFLQDYHLTIKTENSFPHSSGIASSASGMSALALCFMSLENELAGGYDDDFFFRKASFLARIGSGSASRSIYGKTAVWGEHHDFIQSSNLYAVPHRENVHPVFDSFNDVILLIHEGSKSVSSTAGHAALNHHPFAESRYREAGVNMGLLKNILTAGDVAAFGELAEREALMLHALMMAGPQPFILMKPNTLAVITAVQEFRKQTQTPVYFTLDAGANVHILFPDEVREKVLNFIEGELVVYCENKQYICDRVGNGPVKQQL